MIQLHLIKLAIRENQPAQRGQNLRFNRVCSTIARSIEQPELQAIP